MSLELRNGIWHLRYRINGQLLSESTFSRDRSYAEALDKRRNEELAELRLRRRAEQFLKKTARESKQPKVAGVYFLYAVESGLVKIGFSSNAHQRTRGIAVQGGNHYETIAVIRCANYKEIEAYLHHRYRRFHVKGEWFQLPGLDLGRAIGDACRLAKS